MVKEILNLVNTKWTIHQRGEIIITCCISWHEALLLCRRFLRCGKSADPIPPSYGLSGYLLWKVCHHEPSLIEFTLLPSTSKESELSWPSETLAGPIQSECGQNRAGET